MGVVYVSRFVIFIAVILTTLMNTCDVFTLRYNCVTVLYDEKRIYEDISPVFIFML